MHQEFAKQIFQKTLVDYDTIAGSFSETRERIYDLAPLVSEVKIGETVLDVGCGNGRLLDALPIGVRYTGCDTSKQMLGHAKQRYAVPLPYAQFVFGDILSLPFPDASFDHVFALAVLHHIPSEELRQQAVAELARVVKPEGHIVITVWNLRNFYWIRRYQLWRLLLGLYPKGYDRGDCLILWKRGMKVPLLRYVHAFTIAELRNLVESLGFVITRMSSGKNHTVHVVLTGEGAGVY